MKRVEVRCCCDPGKLLGTVEVPSDFVVAPGRRLKFAWFEARYPPFTDPSLPPRSAEVIELEIGEVIFPVTRFNIPATTFAFKSNDIPIERLKKIPSWRSSNVVEL
jgi:hypothetical protein